MLVVPLCIAFKTELSLSVSYVDLAQLPWRLSLGFLPQDFTKGQMLIPTIGILLGISESEGSYDQRLRHIL